jgi:hypothetical protein
MNAVNHKINELEIKTNQLEQIVQTALPATQGVFYDGQIFDAYVFVSGLIKKANKSIVLIDNYIDESVLVWLTKKNKNVAVTIYTQENNKTNKLDFEKLQKQYTEVKINTINTIHDRFLILDDSEIYHIGASFKDLGKKWFALSKLNIQVLDFLKNLNF